jgi:hypothetical protein
MTTLALRYAALCVVVSLALALGGVSGGGPYASLFASWGT